MPISTAQKSVPLSLIRPKAGTRLVSAETLSTEWKERRELDAAGVRVARPWELLSYDPALS